MVYRIFNSFSSIPRLRQFSLRVLGLLGITTMGFWLIGCQQQPAKLDVSALQAIKPIGFSGVYDPSTFILGKGDRVKVEVWRHEEFDGESVVGHSGEIELPGLGALPAEGRTIDQVHQAITERLKTYLKDPRVTVTPSEIASRKVYVLGEVAQPGVQVFEYDYYFWNVLAGSGGFTRDADKEKVLLLRKGSDDLYRPSVIGLDFTGATAEGFAPAHFAVQKDDIIYVMPTGLAKAERVADKVFAVLNPVLSIERATVLWPELVRAIRGSTETNASSTIIVSP